MQVRLTAKLADVVNGIDLSHCSEGDVIELPERDARLLVAEKWAALVDEREEVACVAVMPEQAVFADAGRTSDTPSRTRPER